MPLDWLPGRPKRRPAGTLERTPQDAATRSSPVQEAIALLSDRNAETLGRVVRNLEIQRVQSWRTDGVRLRSFDQMLDALRGLIRQAPPARVASVSRLAFQPVEVLFVDGADPRPWSVCRSWLSPTWIAARRRSPNRLAEICDRHARLVAIFDGHVPADELAHVAGEAQGALRDVLAEILADPGFIEAQAQTLVRGTVLHRSTPDAGERFAAILERLRTALAARHEAGGRFETLRAGVDQLAGHASWRSSPAVENLAFDLGRTLALLAPGEPEHWTADSAAAAFLVLLGRSLGHPWMLLEVVRRRTMILLRDTAARDSRATADVTALADDLAGGAEAMGQRLAAALGELRAGSQDLPHVLAVADAASRLGVSLKGIESIGFLDAGGRPFRRLNAARDHALRLQSDLLPQLVSRAMAPVGGATSDDAAHSLEAARRCAAFLRRLVDVGDALRCRAAVHRAAEMVLDAVQVEMERLIATRRAEGAVATDRIEAILRLAEAISPQVGAALRLRVGSLDRPPNAQETLSIAAE